MAIISHSLLKTATGKCLLQFRGLTDKENIEKTNKDGEIYTVSYSVLNFSALDRTRSFDNILIKCIGTWESLRSPDYTQVIKGMGFTFSTDDDVLSEDEAFTVDGELSEADALTVGDTPDNDGVITLGRALDDFLKAQEGKRFWANILLPEGTNRYYRIVGESVSPLKA
jgi:hypothetical protein